MAALAAVFLLAAAAVTATVLLRGGGYEVRYEVDTSSRTTRMITWTTGTGDFGTFRPETPGDLVKTPWSTTVTFEDINTRASVATDTPTGTATCRIFVDGKKVAESTMTAGAICDAVLSEVIN